MCVIETFTDTIYHDETGRKIVRQAFRTRRGKVRYRYVALERCQQCGADYVPTRRGVQKYCGDSCRSKACRERKQYQTQHAPTLQPIVPTDQVAKIPSPAEDSWNWTRAAENAVASGTVAYAQYHAIESLLSEHQKQLMQEIKQSEARTAQLIEQVGGIQKKKKLAIPHNRTSAKKTGEIARKLLE